MSVYTGQDVFRELETRHHVGFVQGIKDSVTRAEQREVQYLEVKQMIDMLIRYRTKMKKVLAEYRDWKTAYEAETDEIEKVYTAYEGIYARRQFADCWKLYVTVNKDYHDMRRAYLANIRQTPHTTRSAAA